MKKRTGLIIGLIILTFVLGSIRSGEVVASEVNGLDPKEDRRDLRSMTGITLKESVDQTTWTTVFGALGSGYTMVLDPANQYEYLDVETLVADPAIADGDYPFILDVLRVPTNFWSYWAAKGVFEGATGWQAVMWEIINGGLPIFYLRVSGTTYHLIDGFAYATAGEPALVNDLVKVNGDYPLHTYNFEGTVGGENLVLGITFTHEVTPSLRISGVEPEAIVIDGCGYVDVTIHLDNVVNLYAVDLSLTFDPALVEVVDQLTDEGVNPGVNLLPVAPWDSPAKAYTVRNIAYNEDDPGTNENEAGTIRYVSSLLNSESPITGGLDVAVIRLRAKSIGTSALTITGMELSDRDGYLVGVPLAVAVPYSVTTQFTTAGGLDLGIIRLDAANVQLSWSKIEDASYALYRSPVPYFDIATGTLMNSTDYIPGTTTVTFTDPVLGNVATNYFYSLQVTCQNGFESPASWQVGKFEFELFETNTKDLTWIGLVLEMPGIVDTEDLAYHIEHNIYSGNVDVLSISQWNAPAQNTTTYIYPTGTAFNVFVKQPYRITVNIDGEFLNYQSVIWAQVGRLPAITQNDYSFLETSTSDFVWIVQPLEMSAIVNTTQLTSTIETDTSLMVDVLSISTYNAIAQNFTSGSFSTRFGYPYRIAVSIDGSTPVLWP